MEKTLVVDQLCYSLWFLNCDISLYIQTIFVFIFNVTRGAFSFVYLFLALYGFIARTASETTENWMVVR